MKYKFCKDISYYENKYDRFTTNIQKVFSSNIN